MNALTDLLDLPRSLPTKPQDRPRDPGVTQRRFGCRRRLRLLILAVLAVAGIGLSQPLLADFGVFQTLEHRWTGFDGLEDLGAVVLTSDGEFLITSSVEGLGVFGRDPVDGALARVEHLWLEPPPAGAGARLLALSPDDRHLYVADRHTATLRVYLRDPLHGLLEWVETLTDNLPGLGASLLVSPDGRHLYRFSGATAVARYTREGTTGSLTLDGVFPLVDLESPEPFGGVAMSRTGDHFYLPAGDAVVHLDRDVDGSLTVVEHVALATVGPELQTAVHLGLDPTGETLYVSGTPVVGGPPALLAFDRDLLTGALQPSGVTVGDSEAWGQTPGRLGFDPSGTTVVFSTFRRLVILDRGAQGALTERSVFQSDDLIFPLRPVFDTSGRDVYVGDGIRDALLRFELSSSGELLPVETLDEGNEGTFDGLDGPQRVWTSALGENLYVVDRGNHVLAQYRRDPSGLLEQVAALALADFGSPRSSSAWVDHFTSPDETLDFLVQLDCATGIDLCTETLWVFRRRSEDGGLEFLDTFERPGESSVNVVSPDNRTVLTAPDSSRLVARGLDAANGRMGEATEVALELGGFQSFALSPDGRHLYAGGQDTRPGASVPLRIYARDPATNALTLQGEVTSPEGFGNLIHRLRMTRDGRFLFATVWSNAEGGPQGLVVLGRDPSTGTLTEIQRLETALDDASGPANPLLGSLSPSETRLLVAVRGATQVYERDPASGLLTLADTTVPVELDALAPVALTETSAWSREGDQLYVIQRDQNRLLGLAEDLPEACQPGATTLCLGEGGRFRVEVAWEDFDGAVGEGQVATESSDGQTASSGIFWFFEPDNWELMVKVVDGCALNGRHWVFAAATTNIDFTLEVTDTQGIETVTYRNALGSTPRSITDTQAIKNCP